MSKNHRRFRDSKITVETVNGIGEKVIITGRVPDFSIFSSADEADVVHDDILDSEYIFRERYFIGGRLSPGWEIKTETKKKVKVLRTAEIQASDHTVEAYERARVQAGAPLDAKLSIAWEYFADADAVVEDLINPKPVVLVFRWEEEVDG